MSDEESRQVLPTVMKPQQIGMPNMGGDLNQLTQYWVAKRHMLEQQVAEIERFLGFVELSESLAVRVAKIEQFLGIRTTG